MFSLGFSLTGTQVNEMKPSLTPESQFLTGSEQVFYDSCDDASGWIQVHSETEWGGDIFCSNGGLQTNIDLLESINPTGRLECAYIPYISGPYNHGPMWYKSLDTLAQIEQGLELSVNLEQNYIPSRMGHVYVALFDQNREAMFVCNVRDSWYGSRVDFRAWYNKLDSEGGGISSINTFTTSLSCSYNIKVWYDESSDTIKSTIGSQSINLLHQPSFAEKDRVATEIVISYSAITNFQFQGQRINTITVNSEDVLPECNMDVLIVYDDTAYAYYCLMGYNPQSQMVTDVHFGLHEFYNRVWPNMNFHVTEEWMIHDANALDGYDGGSEPDYYNLWLNELGWPIRGETSDGTHFGPLGTQYPMLDTTNLHGLRFDYLVMLTYADCNTSSGAGGINAGKHNAMMVDLKDRTLDTWSYTDIFGIPRRGIWSDIAHESGHGYGIGNHDPNPSADIMSGGQDFPESFTFSVGTSSSNHEIVENHLNIHDESFWYLDEWSPEVSVAGMYVEGYAIDGGYSVNTIDYWQDMSYLFYGRFTKFVKADSNGMISGEGYYSQYDTFNEYLRPNRRWVWAYVTEYPGGPVVRSYNILSYEDEVNIFHYREFQIVGLTPGNLYYISFGRPDSWRDQYFLKAEWKHVLLFNEIMW